MACADGILSRPGLVYGDHETVVRAGSTKMRERPDTAPRRRREFSL